MKGAAVDNLLTGELDKDRPEFLMLAALVTRDRTAVAHMKDKKSPEPSSDKWIYMDEWRAELRRLFRGSWSALVDRDEDEFPWSVDRVVAAYLRFRKRNEKERKSFRQRLLVATARIHQATAKAKAKAKAFKDQGATV